MADAQRRTRKHICETVASVGGFAQKLRSSLCNLSVLCVSVVSYCCELVNHRGTENTEVAQRKQ